MSRSAVVIGLGELGRLFGGALLSLGYTVYPVRRGDKFPAVPAGTPVLIATGEASLAPAANHIPLANRGDAILVQNELFASVWTAAGLPAPTVCMVWFAKKPGQPIRIAQDSLVFGPHAELFCALCEKLNVPARTLNDVDALTLGLVVKYAFILSINALGLEHAETIGWWQREHPDSVRAIISDTVTLGINKAKREVDAAKAERDVAAAMTAMADYPARGRSAPQRVQAAARDAAPLALSLPALARAERHLQ